ncbi:protein phosphatase 1 regulatory subunit 7-like [Asterias rubens]|uniref:protein phosphatase 1 regulatory subunit 7-like n=1 Tax=Asterias rubens TaxID=7604 RepID=UPI001455B967|nr:protein phosphatase 1 regulatory subunit 7-like [Asterias rubens]
MSEEGTSVNSSSVANIAITGTIPIITISTHRDPTQQPVKLPKLPSNRYRYTVWHELRSNEITGDGLHNPRVRRAPKVKDKIFHTIQDEHGDKLNHGKKGQEKKEYEKKMENWENCQAVNLSYQELADRYQMENFLRILKRLIRAKTIQLINDDIEDLSKVSFPACSLLNLNNNYLKSFKKLPKCQNLKILNLSDNSIKTLDGLQSLQNSGLVTMDLRRNPVCFTEHYRQRVFQILPDLRELDGIPRLTSDIDGDLTKAGCVIS